MNDLRSLIANAKKSLPPLKKVNNENEEIILIEANSNSIVEKLTLHRKNEIKEDNKCKQEISKWFQFKEQMVIDMENKRNKEWEQNLNDKKLEDDENEDGDLFEDGDDMSENKEDVIEDVFPNSGNDENIQDNIPEGCDDEDTSQNKVSEIDSENEESNEDCLFKRKHKLIQLDVEDDDDDVVTNSFFSNEYGTVESTSQIYENFDSFKDNDNIFISQNLPLTPMFALSENVENGITQRENLIVDNFKNTDSQMLLDLCSGQFNEATAASERKINNLPESIQIVQSDDDESDDEQSELSDDDEINNQKINKKRIKKLTRQFIEEEAELSGSEDDVSSDENEDELGDEFEQEEIQEELPSDGELKEQVEKIFNKDALDEDKRQLMILKEMFFEDGDLHDEGGNRNKKFKWRLNGEELDDFTNVLSDSEEEEDEDCDEENTNNQKVVRLKKDSENDFKQEENTSNSKSTTTKSITLSNFDSKIFSKPKIGKQNSKISSFFIRDERLKGILNNKRQGNFNETSCKKLKSQESKSIFDALNC